MYTKVKYLGFAHPEVVKCSQELDGLINRHDSDRVITQGNKKG